jgi:hypothetical protein
MKHDAKLIVYHWQDDVDYDGQRIPIVQTSLDEHDPGADNTHIARVKMSDDSTMTFFVEIAALRPLTETTFGELKRFDCFIYNDLEYFKTDSYKCNAVGVHHRRNITLIDTEVVLTQEAKA